MSFTPRTDDVDNVMAVDVNEAYCLTLLNNTLTATAGSEVVIQDTTADKAFTSTTTEGDPKVIGVVADVIAASDSGLVMNRGHVAAVAVVGAVSRGDYLITSTTEWFAKSCGATWRTGVFAIALTAAAGPGQGSVEAYLFGGPPSGSVIIDGGLTVNESGGDNDSRFEGDTDVNLLFVDAGADRVGIGTNAPEAKFHVKTAGVGAMIFEGDYSSSPAAQIVIRGYTDTDDLLSIGFQTADDFATIQAKKHGSPASVPAPLHLQPSGGELIVNEAGGDYDTRFEGDGDENLLYLDAGNDRIGIGTNAPNQKLDVRGSVVFNEEGGVCYFRVEGNNDANLLFTDGANDYVGIGTGSPADKLDVHGNIRGSTDIGLLGKVRAPHSVLSRINEFHPAGIRDAADNTYCDILQFTAGSGGSGKVATVSGLLTLTALAYATGGYYQMRSRLLFVSLRKMTTSAMSSTIQQIGTDNVLEYAAKATTLTVQEKAGATATNLVIQAKVTCADYNTGRLFYTFIAGAGAMSDAQAITATVLSD